MNWWKAHHGIATDLKYAVVLRHIQKSNALRNVTNAPDNACPVTRSDIVSVWVWLIDFSSQNSPRGSIDGIEVDEIAASLDLLDDSVSAIIAGLRWKGMITGNLLTAFEKRQPLNDSTNAERQARHREKLKQEAGSNALRNVTNALRLAREDGDGDGDGDGEVLVVNDLLSTTEVLSVGRDGRESDRPIENRFLFMKSALTGYMQMNGQRPTAKPPDDVIVNRCLAAVNGTDLNSVAEFLRDRYVNREQSPRHPNGPRKYSWFVTVLSEQFGGHE